MHSRTELSVSVAAPKTITLSGDNPTEFSRPTGFLLVCGIGSRSDRRPGYGCLLWEVLAPRWLTVPEDLPSKQNVTGSSLASPSSRPE